MDRRTNLAKWKGRAAAGACAALLCLQPVFAAEVVSVDVEAVAQALSFVQSLPQKSSITAIVVYRGGDGEAKASAMRIAQALSGQPGPNKMPFEVSVVAANELGQYAKRTDLVYVVPGLADGARVVTDFIRRQHVLSVSNDPSCMNTRCCVLLVRGGEGEIVLDSGLAQEVGAKFAAVFTMMVKRR